MRVKIGSRQMPRGSRTKFGVYSASVSGHKVLRRKSMDLYFEGVCDESRLQGEVIPKIRQCTQVGKAMLFPLVVVSYISKAPTLARWASGEKRKPDERSKRFEFLINGDYHWVKLAPDGTMASPLMGFELP